MSSFKLRFTDDVYFAQIERNYRRMTVAAYACYAVGMACVAVLIATVR